MTKRAWMIAGLILLLGAVRPAAAVNLTDTRLLAQPVTSGNQVAFVYAGDLWVAGADGKNVRRLTSAQGVSSPAFSPDGRLIAFTGAYDGNFDVFVVPAEGGVPRRLTWHPGRDAVLGFTPDGKSVLFASARAAFSGRHSQLFTVPVTGGVATPLEIPTADRASYSPDGSRLAYNPTGQAFLQWKHYRGGQVSTIWLYRFGDHAIEKIPQPPDRSNDVDPMWIGDVVYFRSDRNGEFNLFSYETKTKAIKQLTSHADYPVLSASAGGGRIVYEQAGYVHLFDPASGRSTRLAIGVPADLAEVRARFAKGAKWIRAASLSPSGSRVAFEYRGEIVTAPAEKGDPRNITNTTGAHERTPAWSPDGKSIAYFSDEGGEYRLIVRGQDGKGAAKSFKPTGAGFYDRPVWSPDSKKIAFIDNSWSLYFIDVATGVCKKVAAERFYAPESLKTIAPSWSPDSRWIAYTVAPQNIQTVHVYSLDKDKSFPVTDGMSEASEPVFDRSGKYLYFFGSTDAGPVKDWFTMSSIDMRATRSLYLVVLRKDLPSPLLKESDEEKGAPDSSKEEKPKDEKGIEQKPAPGGQKEAKAAAVPPPAAPKDDKKPAETTIDFDGINERILALPLPVGDYSSLSRGTAGQIYFLRTADDKSALRRYDLNSRKDETLLPDVDGYEVSFDGAKLLFRSRTTFSIASTKQRVEPGQGRLNVDAITVRVDPRAEWQQIFDEAWRINRDYFYAPNMHGVDWPAMRQKYAAFLPDLTTRDDLNRVIMWMCSELGTGHHRTGGGDSRTEATIVPGGLLGADYTVENGRYRFKKVYGGLNWNPDLRAPLTEPGVNVKAGDYLLAVNGRELRPPTSVYEPFENTAGRIVEITVGPSADGASSRTVQVVPIGSEAALRNRDWVEGNLKKVHDATAGRVAYVYVPNTSVTGHDYFKRYFYPQAGKDAIIVDERFNGGGMLADYYLDILQRPVLAYWTTRYGADFRTPTGIQGPKVLIADETAGSGGDYFPWVWKKLKLGPVVGKRTWGGLVGVLGFPVLMDGGFITAPNVAIWTPEQGWVVENEGVAPDIEVEQTPADVIAGRDPQLEKAIALALEGLKKNAPTTPAHPPFPEKMKNGKTTK